MTVLEAVEKVLSDAGVPLSYREITDRIINQGLWQPDGKTPHATVSAQLATNIKKPDSRFERTGKGLYGLRKRGPGNGKPPRNGTMSFTDAAEWVLQNFSNRAPMHYRTITETAMRLGAIATAGQTPEATMNAQIIQEIARQQQRGENPRFVKHGKGLIGLSSWMPTGLARQIAQHNKTVRQALHEQLGSMSPKDFEALVGRLLVALGFEDAEVTQYSGDGGVDVRGTLVVGGVIRIRMAVQAKRYKNNIQSPVVQQVRGSLGAHDQGLIITTSDFSAGAREEAQRPNAVPVALMNGEQLVALLVEHNIGVQRTSHDLIELANPAEPVEDA